MNPAEASSVDTDGRRTTAADPALSRGVFQLAFPRQQRPAGDKSVVWRHRGNPIIHRNPMPEIRGIYNSAVVPFDDIYQPESRSRSLGNAREGHGQRRRRGGPMVATHEDRRRAYSHRDPDGWLMIYHGVIDTCNGFVYSMGAAILDIEKPLQVLYRTNRHLLTPEAPYETTGHVPNVVFPCAALHDPLSGRLAIY